MEEAEVRDTGFISAQGDANQILGSAEDIFDAVSPAIERLVELLWVTPTFFRWDHGCASA
jgi:hypothetical protein